MSKKNEKPKKKLYISKLSGGKDSVAMTDLLLKNGYPVDLIAFSDTGLEHSEMYLYIEKLKKYFKEKYNKEIITIKANKTIEDWMFGEFTRGKFKGTIRGFPNPRNKCYWQTIGKIAPYNKFLTKYKKDYEIFTYLGITNDEVHRKQVQENIIYPLIDYFNMSENDCLEYTKKINLFNPLYEHFTRTGCFLCPKQKQENFKTLFEKFPEKWKELKRLQSKMNEVSKNNEVLNPIFKSYKMTFEEMEEDFLKLPKKEINE